MTYGTKDSLKRKGNVKHLLNLYKVYMYWNKEHTFESKIGNNEYKLQSSAINSIK